MNEIETAGASGVGPKVALSVLADQFIIDRVGKFSIVGVFDGLGAPSFPAAHPQMYIVTVWEGEVGVPFMVQTRLRAPDGLILLTTPLTSIEAGINGKAWAVNLLVQTQFPAAGKYRFELLANEVVVGIDELTMTKVGGGENVPLMPQSTDIKMLN